VNDLEILRQYEPVLRFTEGELFFPCAVEGYVRRSSLLRRTRDRDAAPIVRSGDLDIERLVLEGSADPSRALCLRLVDEPLKGLDFQRWRMRPDRPVFRTSGRLARVGLLPRFVDSLFELSLLLRGSVPGGTAAAAEEKYRNSMAEDPRFVYYGRVVRDESWIMLNYLFFYYMNDWRSTFSGVNDHEADWEQIFVFLAIKKDGSYEPAWLAYASHDFHGDDCRRRWDDPELTFEGQHPVVFPGAGSHSAYFQAGEYLTSVELPHARPLFEAIRVGREIWQQVLRQGEPQIAAQVEGLLRIPFVDYARGDGRSFGPGQEHEWSPVVIDDLTPWVDDYRGLWGLDTHDPLQGELAPSGPKYQRDATVRQTWFDPLGWAGLAKVAPPTKTVEALNNRIKQLEEDLHQIDGRLGELDRDLPGREIEARALRPITFMRPVWEKRDIEMQAKETERNALRRRRVEVDQEIAEVRQFGLELGEGRLGDPQAHLRRKRSPQSEDEMFQSRLAEVWAGLSIVVLLLGGVAAVVLARQKLLAVLLVLTAVVVVENALRGSLQRLLLNITVLLAVISALVLVYQFFWPICLFATVVIAIVILRDNLRELRGM
jgi:hypothetical protein